MEVLSGVDPQDSVVVNPPDSITDGISVRIAPSPQDQGAAALQTRDKKS